MTQTISHHVSLLLMRQLQKAKLFCAVALEFFMTVAEPGRLPICCITTATVCSYLYCLCRPTDPCPFRSYPAIWRAFPLAWCCWIGEREFLTLCNTASGLSGK